MSKIIAAFLLLSFATSCVETVVVGGAATSVLLVREKSLVDTKNDVKIATYLNAKFLKEGLKNPGNIIDVMVNEGRVLLTGIARDPEKAKLAIDFAWKAGGVKEVIDEIQVSENESITPKDAVKDVKDYWITAQIETKFLFSKKISTVNYKITTVSGTAYILGVAEDDIEMRAVLSTAAKTNGVKKVVNHVILANDSRRRNG